MINFGFSRIRILALLFVVLSLGLVGTFLVARDGSRLEPLPLAHGRPNPHARPAVKTTPAHETTIKEWSIGPPRVPCVGPRGLVLESEGNDDNPRENIIDIRKLAS